MAAVSRQTERALIDGRLLNKVAVRLIPFMFVLYIISFLDRINISFAALQMNKELGFDDRTYGFGAGIFFLGYCLFGVPSNLMVERLGARRWITIIMIVWGLISMAMAGTNSPISFFILRFLLGVAEAGFFPGMILYLTYWFPKREQGKAVARFMTAIPAAGIIGSSLTSMAFAFHGMMGLPGWKWVFLVTGAPAVILGAVTYFYLVDGPKDAKWLSEEERQKIIEAVAADRAEPGPPSQDRAESSSRSQGGAGAAAVSQAFLSGRVWLLALLYFSLTVTMYGFQLWLPQIVKGFEDVSDSTVALLCIIPAIFQALGMLVVAGNSDRTGERKYHVAVSAGIAALGFVATAFSSTSTLSMISLCATAFGIWGCVGPFWAVPTSYLKKAAAAAGIALINSIGNLGGFAGPYVIGYIKSATADFKYGMVAMACSLAITILLVSIIKIERSDAPGAD